MSGIDSGVVPRRAKRARRWPIRLVLAGTGLFFAGELFARYGLGLGTPPLSMNHPTIEYLYQPSQDVRRFGNRFLVNAYSMRSQDFPPQKADPRELRVLVLGDSVINGGNLSDHEDLATTRLQRSLADELNRPVVVMNASAVSWGPGNLLAYVDAFGFFDADHILLVVSSQDARDERTFRPIDPYETPTHRPLSALAEGLWRYLPRYLPGAAKNAEGHAADQDRESRVSEKALAAWRELIDRAKAQSEAVSVIQHFMKAELALPEAAPGLAALSRVAAENGLAVFSSRPALEQAGPTPYRDHIHLNPEGQRRLAALMHHAVAGPGVSENAAPANPPR